MDIYQYEKQKKEQRDAIFSYVIICLLICAAALCLIGIVYPEGPTKTPPAPPTVTTTTTPPTGGGTAIAGDWSTELPGMKEMTPLTDADALKTFNLFNHLYFEDKLPIDTIVSFSDEDPNTAAFYINGQRAIRLRPYLATVHADSRLDTAFHDTMLHEMAHEYIDVTFSDKQAPEKFSGGHGIHWRAEMRHLAAIGAFDDKLWSSEDK